MKRLALGLAVVLMASVAVRAEENPTVEVSGFGDSVSIEAKDGWLHLHSPNGTELKSRVIALTSKGSPRVTVEALPGSQLRLRRVEDGTGDVVTIVCSHLQLTRHEATVHGSGSMKIGQ